MKKICMITTVSLTLKVFVVETAIFLHKNCGYDVTLICNNDEEFKKSLPDFIHYIPVSMSRGINIADIKSIKEFIRIFKEQNFDMVQFSTPNAACYASIASRIVKVPIRLYCQWGIRYTGMAGPFKYIFKCIEKMVCNNSTDIWSVSPLNKKFAVTEGLYSESKATVVGNGGTIGVDLSIFDIASKNRFRQKARREYNISDEAFVFGFVGRLSPDKGCLELITAFSNIAKQNKNVVLLVVGPLEDNSGLPNDVLDYINKSENVILTGMIDKLKINEFYSAMDVLVHPTYREGFGMVLQEAGALGLGIITTNIPGASEVMEVNKSCLLVAPRNSLELEKAMKTLVDDKATVTKLGNAAYERTKRYYDRSIMLKNQMEAYNTLLNREVIVK